MKFLIVLAVCVAGAFAAPGYTSSYSSVPEIKVSSYVEPAPVVRVAPKYETPVVRIAAPKYEAPIIRSAPAYEAPIIRAAPTYEAPVIRSSYVAPSYAAPAYTTPVRSYEPIVVRKPIIPIKSFHLEDDNYGTFTLRSLSGDGSAINQQGNLKDLGDKEGPVSVMSGSYSFVGDDGVTYTTNWVADENGFHATGAHLPTPPPIPAEIQASLLL